MIPIITILISALGLVMLTMMAARVYELGRITSLKKHRNKQEGVNDLLQYAAEISDGVIVCKNGALMAAWLYEGDDHGSSTDDQRNLLSYRINQGFSGLGNGWMVHVDAVRRPASNYSEASRSHFPDPLTAAVDEERRRLFESLGTMYEGYFVLTLTYLPPMLAERKFVEMMFDDDAVKQDSKGQTRGLVERFERAVKTVESRMSAAVTLTRLKGKQVTNEDGTTVTHDDFLRWLQFCITGINQPMLLPTNPMYLDAVLGGQELHGGVIPKLGRHFIQVVAIEGFPQEAVPGILSALAEQPSEYRWSTRYIFMDNHDAVAQFEKFRKKWKQKIRGFIAQVFNTNSGVVDQDAIMMVADSEAAIAEVNSGMVSSGYYTSTIILMDESRERLEDSSRLIESAVQKAGFAARVETINTLDAFFGSLPGHGVENVRRPLINTLNLADLLPTSTIWAGHNFAPCPFYPPNSPPLMHCVTHGSTPFRFNTHEGDLGHGFMFGPTRAGKSTHLGILAMQWRRYANSTVYWFDKGMSGFATTKGVGGKHFRVAGEGSRLMFCPLQFLKTKQDRAWAMGWIETILLLNGLAVGAERRNTIAEAIMTMHSEGSRTMSEFSLIVQDNEVRAALEQYTINGMMGELLDAKEDGLALTDFTCFEIEDLMNLGEKFALPVLLYLFRRIEMSLHGQPAVIILDEAWLMLGHPAFRDKIKEWLLAFAKKNCVVLMATQQLSHAVESGILDTILESTAVKIYLPNGDAAAPDASALYRRFGLNDRQIQIIATAIRKRQYYFESDSGRRLYELALGPLALAFVGATDKESIATIQQLIDKHGDAWIDEWLSIKGLSLADYGVAA